MAQPEAFRCSAGLFPPPPVACAKTRSLLLELLPAFFFQSPPAHRSFRDQFPSTGTAAAVFGTSFPGRDSVKFDLHGCVMLDNVGMAR